MAKPTGNLPTWATSGGTDTLSNQLNVLEPPSAKKASGWRFREKPARNWLNWWMNKVGAWVSWVSSTIAGTQSYYIHPSAAAYDSALIYLDGTPTGSFVTSTGVSSLAVPIPIEDGRTLGTISVYCDPTTNAITCYLYKVATSTGAATAIDTQSTSGLASQTVTLTGNITAEAGFTYVVLLSFAAGGGALYGLKYTATWP